MHKHRERRNRTAVQTMAWALIVLLILACRPAPLATAAEPPSEAGIAEVTESSATPERRKKKRRRQRAAKNRRARLARPALPAQSAQSAQSAEQVSQATEPVYGRLQLNGSFSLELGGTNVIHGEGSTTIELDRAAVEKLAEGMEQNLNKAVPALSDWLQIIETLPQTLESTSQILNRLTDPKTQQQLQQVEQLLRLLPPPAE